MKILIVIDSLGSGGAQRMAAYLAQGLAKKSHTVEVFVYNTNYSFFKSDFEKYNIKIRSVNKNSNRIFNLFFPIKVLLKLSSILKNCDGIISFMHTPSIYTAFSRLRNKNNKHIVFEVSSSVAPVSLYKRILFYLAALSSSKVVTNSFNETELMKQKFGLSNKVYTIWNGYNLELMKSNFSENSGRIKKLLIVGRIAYPKNGLNLLKAMSVFLEKNKWVPEVVWAGREDLDERSLKMQNDMKNYLKNHPEISSKFKFLGEVKNINELYQKVDALIHPSIYEGLPNVICEAMILGCCVLASNVCDHPIILAEERGLLFDPKDPVSIFNAIDKFNSMNIMERNEMAKKARKFSEENFTLKKHVESFEKVLKNN